MNLKYIREYYNVPAKRGIKVIAHGREGTIVGAYGPYLRIKIEGEKHNGKFAICGHWHEGKRDRELSEFASESPSRCSYSDIME